MSQIYVAGPSQLYTGTGASGALEFLGYVEQDVRPTFEGKFEPVYTDVGGSAVPFDTMFMGEEAFVSFDLIQYNESVLYRVAQRLNAAGQTAGAIQNNQIGSLMRTEGMFFRFLIYSTYGTKAAMAGGGMVPAMNFPVAWAEGPIDLSLGTRAKRVHVMIHSTPAWVMDASGNWSYVLWNQSTTGKPTAPN